MKKAEFVDAQEMHRKNPKTFEVPSDEELSNIKVGGHVKVCAERERFWVKVTKVENKTIQGEVDNELVSSDEHNLFLGDEIEFHFDNVYSIYDND